MRRYFLQTDEEETALPPTLNRKDSRKGPIQDDTPQQTALRYMTGGTTQSRSHTVLIMNCMKGSTWMQRA